MIPGSGRSPGQGIDYPLQYSGLEKGKATHSSIPSLKGKATHSSILAYSVHKVAESDTTEQLHFTSVPSERLGLTRSPLAGLPGGVPETRQAWVSSRVE